MFSASSAPSRLRLGVLRFSGARGTKTPFLSRHSHNRLFSSVLQLSCSASRRSSVFQFVANTRSFTNAPREPASVSNDLDSLSVPEFVPDGLYDSPTDAISSATSHIPAALQYGDFAAAGLASWWPSGIINWSFELINVATGLPWFWTIVAGSVFWKLVVLPISISGIRNSSRLMPYQGELKEVQKQMALTRASSDTVGLQQQAAKIHEIHLKAGLNPRSQLLPLLQIPIQLGMFFGLKNLCESGAIEQLKYSGFSLIPDLTAHSEPFYYLPLLLCVLANIQISVGASEMNLENKDLGHIMNFFRLMSIGFMFPMSHFPSGLLVGLITTSSLNIIQSLLMKVKSVRRWLNIPIVPKSQQAKLPSPLETFDKYVATPFREYKTMNKK